MIDNPMHPCEMPKTYRMKLWTCPVCDWQWWCDRSSGAAVWKRFGAAVR